MEEFSVEKVRADNDFVFLAVSGDFALKYAPEIAAGDGPIVIDNSSAFRYIDHIPLVVITLCLTCEFTDAEQVPEINSETLRGAKLIANPNCTTAIAAVALWPIHSKYRIKKLIMSTYQAASGAGAEVLQLCV